MLLVYESRSIPGAYMGLTLVVIHILVSLSEYLPSLSGTGV